MAENCTFYDSGKILLSICGIDYDGLDLAEGIKISEIEAITATPTLSGTTYASANNTDYPVTIMSVKGSPLNKALEDQFINKGCCEIGIYDYNPNSETSIVSDSMVILKKGEVTVGSSDAVAYTCHARWTTI